MSAHYAMAVISGSANNSTATKNSPAVSIEVKISIDGIVAKAFE
ncbi:MAG: hypothetical protein ACRYGK_00570 [Janthinobacterium lividum]